MVRSAYLPNDGDGTKVYGARITCDNIILSNDSGRESGGSPKSGLFNGLRNVERVQKCLP